MSGGVDVGFDPVTVVKGWKAQCGDCSFSIGWMCSRSPDDQADLSDDPCSGLYYRPFHDDPVTGAYLDEYVWPDGSRWVFNAEIESYVCSVCGAQRYSLFDPLHPVDYPDHAPTCPSRRAPHAQ
jgi:hypothetical protein